MAQKLGVGTLCLTGAILSGCAHHVARVPPSPQKNPVSVLRLAAKPIPFREFKSLGMILSGKAGAWNISNDTSRLLRLASLKLTPALDTNRLTAGYEAEFPPGEFQKSDLENALGYLFKVDSPDSIPPAGFEDFRMMHSADRETHCGLMKLTDSTLIYLQLKDCSIEGLSLSSNPAKNVTSGHRHRRFLAALLNTVGLKNLEDTNYREAQRRFQEALSMDSTTPEYLGNRAMLHALRNNPVEGIALMLHYPQLLESSGQLCGILGAFYEEISQYPEARDWAIRAVQKEPDNHEWVINLSDALWALGEKVQSRNVLLKPYAEKPDFRLGVYLAGTYLGLEEYENALGVLKQVHADTTPTPKSAAYQLRACLGLKHFEEGLDFIRKSGAAFPMTAENLFLKAACEFHLRLYRQAVESTRQSLSLNPSDREARELQTQIAALMGDKSNQLLRTPIAPLPTTLNVKQVQKTLRDSAWDKRLAGYPIFLISQQIVHDWPAQGRWKQTRRAFFGVTDGANLIRFSELIFNLNPSYERFHVNRMRIYDSSWTCIHEGSLADYYITKNPDASLHPENLLAHLVLKTRPGRMYVELLTTREAQVPSSEFPYVRFEQVSGYPVIHSRFELLHAPPHLLISPFGDVKIDSLSDRVVLTLPAPAFPSEDGFTPEPETFGSGFSASPFTTWREVGLRYLEELKKAGIEVSKPPLRVRECASEITAKFFAEKSPLENPLKPIFRYVRDSIRYDNDEFSLQAGVPDSAPEVLARGYGDCKGQALLLAQLLRARGLEAHPALVNLFRIGDVGQPHINQFNHMIVYVPRQRNLNPYFLDPTEKFSAFRRSPLELEGRNALILDPANPQLVSIPEIDSADEHSVKIFHDLNVLRDQSAQGCDSLILNGKAASEFREHLNKWSGPVKHQNLLSWLSSGYPAFAEDSFHIVNESDPDAPLIFVLRYHSRFPDLDNGQPFDYFPKLELSFMRFPDAEHRKVPVCVPHEIDVESNWSYHLPTGFEWKSISLARELEQDHLQWRFSIQQGEPEAIVLRQKWQIQPFVADAGEYRKLRSEWEPVFHHCGLRMAISRL